MRQFTIVFSNDLQICSIQSQKWTVVDYNRHHIWQLRMSYYHNIQKRLRNNNNRSLPLQRFIFSPFWRSMYSNFWACIFPDTVTQ